MHFIFLSAELEQLSDHFQLLSALPASTRSSLLQQITKVMEDRTAVCALQNLVSGTERSCQGRSTLIMWSQHYELLLCYVSFKSGLLPLSQLDQMCLDKSPTLGDVMMTESQKQNVQAILGLLEQSGEVDSAQTERSTSVLSAFHLITSALDGENALLCAAFITDNITSL